jgi:anti-sigma regulatory factor (Ser/Thr protein kinase)
MTTPPASAIDFMVSYTGKDAAWAEWIAWQLKAEGYRVSLQAWDIPPGSDFVAEMNQMVRRAQRIVAVMSPDYLESGMAESEWRPFFDKDPSGREGLILPIRVAPFDSSEKHLLSSRVYVNLFDLSQMEARTALLSAVRAKRGVPVKEPEFPGRALNSAAANSAVPLFPGRAKQALQFPQEYELYANELGGLRTLSAELSEYLMAHGYSEEDSNYFTISLHELVTNAAKHVPNAKRVRVLVEDAPRERYNYHDSLMVQVIDEGGGFDFDSTLARLEQELGRDDIEHGLLRAIRLSSVLSQESLSPHTMALWKERTPSPASLAFADLRVFPIVFDHRLEAIRIGSNVHTFFQFEAYLQRSQEFMALIFDPLLRSPAKVVGIEILGQGWTGVLRWEAVIDRLVTFARAQPRLGKKLVLFAETGPSDHRRLRKYCKQHAIRLFENRDAVAKFLDTLPKA